jgi:DNA-binding winged helix-turn-helix (wHTH) protein
MVTTAASPRLDPVRLGPVQLEPALLELSGPQGRRTLEPRVMQVLAELMHAEGRPVSRDTLSLRCWRNPAVSEDALNRAVAKARRDLRAIAGAAVVLETIRSVGYRLREEGPGGDTSTHSLIVPAIDLETRALAAMFEGTAEGFALAVHYLTQAVAERPTDGLLYGSLAMAHVLSLPVKQNDAALVAARAREAALQAQALQPGEGRSLAALASLEPTFGAWAQKDAMLRNALGRAPAGTAPLIFQRVLFLASTGAMKDAASLIEPLAAKAPLVPWVQSARAHVIAANDRLEEAVAVARAAFVRWPHDRLVWYTVFHLTLSSGRTVEALELARNGSDVSSLTAVERGLAVDLVETIALASASRITAVLDGYAQAFSLSQTIAEQAVLAAAHLRATDRAVGFLQRLYQEAIPFDRGSIAFPKIGLTQANERSTALLFLQPMHSIREHPNFAHLLASVGLPTHAENRS